MTSPFVRVLAIAGTLVSLGASLPAAAWDMSGTKTIALHNRDGDKVAIGTVTFTPKSSQPGAPVAVSIHMDHARFKDFFLSMKEFKCLEAPTEVFCHVPYPYKNPEVVTTSDMSWLEHALMFMFKAPREFGAKLWNGVYYKLQLTDKGLVGRPQAVDLNQIGAPPADLNVPPYGPGERTDIPLEARWFNKLTIE